MDIIEELFGVFMSSSAKNAICDDGKFYTYNEFGQIITGLRRMVSGPTYKNQQIFGVDITENVYTYAAILALWFERKAYVPINASSPTDIIDNICFQTGIETILSGAEIYTPNGVQLIVTRDLSIIPTFLPIVNTIGKNDLMYILFTSGTTGEPKGVPIHTQNLEAFRIAWDSLNFQINDSDRCLQMCRLTFDVSIMSFLLCFLGGGCLYPIPEKKIKFQYISEILETESITIAFMVPSILNYLRPYFDELHYPLLRFNLFAGEALVEEVISEWEKCIPNAEIINAYGPTENTIVCSALNYKRNSKNKTFNGILSIGKPMHGNTVIIINDNDEIVENNTSGQLCLAGDQLTSGYWMDENKTKKAFISLIFQNEHIRFYKTGDLCSIDSSGDIMYMGRVDNQVKIQGYRVELTEVEFQAKSHLKKVNLIALGLKNKIGNNEIVLILESRPFDLQSLKFFLEKKLQPYMVPTQYQFEESFPLNGAGKIDRNALLDKLRFQKI